jgi:hypothetical protein
MRSCNKSALVNITPGGFNVDNTLKKELKIEIQIKDLEIMLLRKRIEELEKKLNIYQTIKTE